MLRTLACVRCVTFEHPPPPRPPPPPRSPGSGPWPFAITQLHTGHSCFVRHALTLIIAFILRFSALSSFARSFHPTQQSCTKQVCVTSKTKGCCYMWGCLLKPKRMSWVDAGSPRRSWTSLIACCAGPDVVDDTIRPVSAKSGTASRLLSSSSQKSRRAVRS